VKSLSTLFAPLNRSPVPYVSEGQAISSAFGFGEDGRQDPKRQLDLYGAVSTLFAIVSATSTATSNANWRLWRKSASGNKEDRVEVTAHPALVVWNNPNPFYSQQEFVESEEQHVDLTGEGWWVLYRDPRMPNLGPMEIWPVRPDRMFPIKSTTDFLTGYVYRSPDGQEIPLEKNEVIQLRIPNPNDPYRGMGPVQSLLSMLVGHKAALDYNRNFFINGAGPGGLIEFPEELDDDDWRRFKRRWDAGHKGVANAHKVGILEGGAKWVERNYSYKDMQFTELTGVSRDMIREAFLIHKHILGQSDDVNLANALVADKSFVERVVKVRLNRFKGALNNDFLPMFPGTDGLEFDYDDPSPHDATAIDAERTSKTTAFSVLVTAGVAPEDAANVVGLPPMSMRPVPVGGSNEGPISQAV
jgi:HK97 family phage portal protein